MSIERIIELERAIKQAMEQLDGIEQPELRVFKAKAYLNHVRKNWCGTEIKRDAIHEGAIAAGEIICQRCGAHCERLFDRGTRNTIGWICPECKLVQSSKWVNG